MRKPIQVIPCVLMSLALLAAANCFKHLMRIGAWSAIVFIAIKEVAVIATVAYMFRVSHRAETPNSQNLSVFAMYAVLGVSFVGDTAMVFLKG